MQKLAGYTRYFNEKYKRSGVLFQGKFKSKHIDTNEYLLHVSAYINMNNRDKIGTPSTKLSKSSYEEYFEGATGLCDKDIILEQFKNKNEYKEFALSSWEFTRELREDLEN